MTKSSRIGAMVAAGLLAACGGQGNELAARSDQLASAYALTTLPSVTVSGVTATSPVLRSTASIAVSATVTPTFDTGSGPTSVTTTCKSNGGNNNCGTGNPLVTDQTVVTTTTVTVGNTSTAASAAAFNDSEALAVSGTAYAGTLATPTSGTDGTIPVTVTANVSEDVTTTVTTVTTNQNCTSTKGVTTCTTVGTTTVTTTDVVTKTGSNSGTGSYVLDINPPLLTLMPDSAQPKVSQGGNKNVHNLLIGGSSDTAYTLNDLVQGPCVKNDDGTVDCSSATKQFSANGVGTFSTGKDGIAGTAHDLVAVHIACDAPVGWYQASASANTKDLGGNPFGVIYSVDYRQNAGADFGGAVDTFEVIPGIKLLDQTQVVSELPPSGDYAPMTCFTATQNAKKVSTFPGSMHVTAVINTDGQCAEYATIAGTKVTISLPVGFKFDTTGGSPPAHVFVVDASNGFDFHYPGPEIALPKNAFSGAATQVLTVDLAGVDLGLGTGVIPSTDTIYVRAHVAFSGTTVPADGTAYTFTTGVESNISGSQMTASSFQTLTKQPASACVNGNPPAPAP